jgi:hypothetical protein
MPDGTVKKFWRPIEEASNPKTPSLTPKAERPVESAKPVDNATKNATATEQAASTISKENAANVTKPNVVSTEERKLGDNQSTSSTEDKPPAYSEIASAPTTHGVKPPVRKTEHESKKDNVATRGTTTQSKSVVGASSKPTPTMNPAGKVSENETATPQSEVTTSVIQGEVLTAPAASSSKAPQSASEKRFKSAVKQRAFGFLMGAGMSAAASALAPDWNVVDGGEHQDGDEAMDSDEWPSDSSEGEDEEGEDEQGYDRVEDDTVDQEKDLSSDGQNRALDMDEKDISSDDQDRAADAIESASSVPVMVPEKSGGGDHNSNGIDSGRGHTTGSNTHHGKPHSCESC